MASNEKRQLSELFVSLLILSRSCMMKLPADIEYWFNGHLLQIISTDDSNLLIRGLKWIPHCIEKFLISPRRTPKIFQTLISTNFDFGNTTLTFLKLIALRFEFTIWLPLAMEFKVYELFVKCSVKNSASKMDIFPSVLSRID